jgi:hypothetical protein
MKKTYKKMVATINVDTGKIDNVAEVDRKGKVINPKVPAQRWPIGGIQVGKLVRHNPCGILLYDDSPDDCLILHQGNCWYWRIGC